MIYKNGNQKKYYYFTSIKYHFACGAQICEVWGDAIEKAAKRWGKCNGYDKVYVYDLDHNFVGEYESLA